MADTPETKTETAEPDQAKVQRDIEQEKNRNFAERAIAQALLGVAEGIRGKKADEVELAAAPTFMDFLLRGSESVSTTARVSFRDDLQKIPSFPSIPALRLTVTKIHTGLGPRVDEVLTKSRDEVVKGVSLVYDTLKGQIVTSQKAIATVDKNVRLIDTRHKKFQKDTGKTIESLELSLRKLQRAQTDQEVKFKKIDLGQKKTEVDATASGDGFGLTDALLWSWLGKHGITKLGLSILGTLSSGLTGGLVLAVIAAAKMYDTKSGTFPVADPKARKEIDELRKQQFDWYAYFSGQKPRPGFSPETKRLFKPAPKWAPDTQKPTGILEDVWSLFGGTAKAEERPETPTTGISARGTTGVGIGDSVSIEKTSIALTGKQSILLSGKQDVSLKSPKIVIEAKDIYFQGKVHGLPEPSGQIAISSEQIQAIAEAISGMQAGIQGPAIAGGKAIAETLTGGGLQTAAEIATSLAQAGPVAAGRTLGQIGRTARAEAPARVLAAGATGGLAAAGRQAGIEWTGGIKPVGDVVAATGTGGLAAGGRVAGEAVTGGGIKPVGDVLAATGTGGAMAGAKEAGMAATGGGIRSWGDTIASWMTGGPAAAGRAAGQAWAAPEVSVAGTTGAGAGVGAGATAAQQAVTGELGEYLKEQAAPTGTGLGEVIRKTSPEATLFGPRAPGVPETPGIWGLIGQGAASIAGGLTAGAAALGARVGEWWGGGGGPGGRLGGGGFGGGGLGPEEPKISAEREAMRKAFAETGTISMEDAQKLGWVDKDGKPTSNMPTGLAQSVVPGSEGKKFEFKATPGTREDALKALSSTWQAKPSATETQRAIIDFANRWGISPDAAAGAFQIESKTDPRSRGGASGRYHGMWQLQDSQIPDLAQKAGFGRLTPDKYRQLSPEDQLKVMDEYYKQAGVKKGFFTGDPKTDSAKMWALQLSPGNALKIDYSDPNAIISATPQASTISSGGRVTVGSAMRETPGIGAKEIGGAYEVASGQTFTEAQITAKQEELGRTRLATTETFMRGQKTQVAGLPVGEPRGDMGAAKMRGVDPFLIESIQQGAIRAFGDPNDPNTRYVVDMQGGVRAGSPKHSPGKAVDLQIYDRQTKQYVGGGKDIMQNAYDNPYTYSIYESLARARYQYVSEKYGQDAAEQMSWGGRGQARQGPRGPGGTATDAMHFSIAEGFKSYGHITEPAGTRVQEWLARAGQEPSMGMGDVASWKSPYLPETQVAKAEPTPTTTTAALGAPKVAPGTQDVDINKPYTPKAEVTPVSAPIKPPAGFSIIGSAQAAEPATEVTLQKPLELPRIKKMEEEQKKTGAMPVPPMPGEKAPEVTPAPKSPAQTVRTQAGGGRPTGDVTAAPTTKPEPKIAPKPASQANRPLPGGENLKDVKGTQEARPLPGRQKTAEKGGRESTYSPPTKAASSDAPSSPGNRGTESGGGGASPDRCHFCDL